MMTAHILQNHPSFEHMTGPFTQSLLFHACVVIFAIVGLPMIAPDLPILSSPISVEIVEIDRETKTNKPAMPQPQAKLPPKNELERPPEAKPMPPKVEAAEPPRPVEPKPPVLKDDVALPREALAQDKKPKTLAPDKAPAPKPKPQPEVKKEEPKEQMDDFQKLLKNLQEGDPAQAAPDAQQQPATRPSFMASLGDRMTMSEMDALKRQLSLCWNVAAGARFAEDLVVSVKLFVNPDRTVRDAQIVDKSRYNRDTYYRAAADSALRAVRNPRCSPLELPDGKYEQWKVITINFDPREML